MHYGNVIDNSAASLVFCTELEGRKSALIRRGVCIMCVTKEPAVHVERRAAHVCQRRATPLLQIATTCFKAHVVLAGIQI